MEEDQRIVYRENDGTPTGLKCKTGRGSFPEMSRGPLLSSDDSEKTVLRVYPVRRRAMSWTSAPMLTYWLKPR